MISPFPMLQSLHIKNFAIIDELAVEFGAGLNVVTGETGAGKTIILQALGLLLGERASVDLIRAGASDASITAHFSLDGAAKTLRSFLTDAGIEADDELIIHRLVTTTGKGKIVVSGMPATAQMLKGIAAHLVDISSQHEHQLLLDPSSHVKIVDRFGTLDADLHTYRVAYERYRTLVHQLTELLAREKDAKERLDFLKFQRDELASAHLEIGEDERIDAERARSKHAVTLSGKIREVLDLLHGDEASAASALSKSARFLEQCAVYDEAIASWRESILRAEGELTETSRDLVRYVENLNADPHHLETLEERYHFIVSLKRKHGGTIENCLEKLSILSREIDDIEHLGETSAKIAEESAEARRNMETEARKLTEKRRKVSALLSKEVRRELADLGMKRIGFEVSLTPRPIDMWDGEGAEALEFLISPNVGEELRPLARIASGGELARILLAIKRVLADRAGLAATYVFDEVDAGIGGAVAEAVGQKLKEVATARQVICITHLPQVAAHGDHHYRISKNVAGGRTRTKLAVLNSHERREEIARMLAGSEVTDSARHHADELLQQR